MVQDYQRSALPRWPGDRLPVEHLPEDHRYHDAPQVRRSTASIDEALREQCNIPVKSYFLAVITDDGRAVQFSGPDNIPQHDSDFQQFFSLQQFVQYNKGRGIPVSSPVYFDDPGAAQFESNYDRQSSGPQYASRRMADRRQNKADSFEDEQLQYKTRKRPRAQVYRRDLDDDDAPVSSTSARKPLKVGDSEALWQFYDQRFRNCQQTACKLIAKAWVKAVEPKKQSNHPYTGSDEKAPDWWPKPWGPSRDEKVRHKEPDHLYKKERVHLLNHILRMVIEPNATQHPDIQKLNLTVKKLEEVTTDALSTFFSDKENNNNAKKKPFLKEIFKVARAEERFKNGEIDADYTIHVMPDDKMPDNYRSDTEDSGTKDGDDNGPTSIASSTSSHKPTASHALITTPTTEHSPTGPLHGAPFVDDLPVRPAQYAQSMITSDLQQHHYGEEGPMAAGGQPPLQQHGSMAMADMLAPHDTSRRPSFYSQAEYSAPGAGLYNANSWQTTTTAPNTIPMYANTFTPQQQHHPAQPAPGSYVQQQPATMAQGQSYLGPSYDGLPRYDNDIFRPAAVPHNPAAQSPGYPTYVSHDNRALPGTGYKLDPLGRNPLH